MNQTEQLRRYVEDQIQTSKSRLSHYLDQKSEAEAQITKLTETLELLEGMLSYLDGGAPEEDGRPPAVGQEIQEAQPYAEMSVADGAFHVLRDAGRPLHVSKIWERLEAGGKVSRAKKPTLSVTGALLRDERFEKVGRNIFTLKEVVADTDETS